MNGKLSFRLVICFLSLAILVSCSANSPAEPEKTLQEKLQSALDDSLSRHAGKGASAAVSIPGKEIWRGTSGISHEGVPVRTEMKFAIASITKSFTATLVLKLVEEGRLSLDDRIDNWIPPLPNIAGTITVRQLLNHTSGLYNLALHPDLKAAVLADLTRSWKPEELLTQFVLEPYCAPGAGWNYSNTNYIILGMITEQITGSTLTQQLRSRFFTPLKLQNTFVDAEEETPGVIAHPWYDLNEDGVYVDISDYPRTASSSTGWAAGAIYSTPEDLVRWSNALLHDRTVLGQSTLDQMLDFLPLPGGLGSGLGIFIADRFLDGVQGIGHDGGTAGFSARMVYMPASGVSIAVCVNKNDYDCHNDIARALATVVLEDQ